jgi:RNA polymerase sigma-32 factor
MLARRGCGDREAVHALVTSHLRLVVKIAMGYRGYGLPISEVISEGQCRPDESAQALRAREGLPALHLRYVVDQGLAGEDGQYGQPEEAVLQLTQGEAQDFALDEGDMRSDQVKTIAQRPGVTEGDVISYGQKFATAGMTGAR